MTPLLPAEPALQGTQGQLAQVRQQIGQQNQSLQALSQQELKEEQQLQSLQSGTFRFLVPNRQGKQSQKEQEIARDKAQIASLQQSLNGLQQQEQGLRQQESVHLATVQQLNALRQRHQAAFGAVVNANKSTQLQQLEQKLQSDSQALQVEGMFVQQLEALLPCYRNALNHFASAMQLEMRAEQSNVNDMMYENSFSEYNRDVRMQQARNLAAQASTQLSMIGGLLPQRLFQVNPQLASMLQQVPVANLAANNFGVDMMIGQFGRGADLANDIQTERRLQQNMMVIRQCEMVCQQHSGALQQFIGSVRGYLGTLQGQVNSTQMALQQERVRVFEAARTNYGIAAPAQSAPYPTLAQQQQQQQPPAATLPPYGAPQGQGQPPQGARLPQQQQQYGAAPPQQQYGAAPPQQQYGAAPQGMMMPPTYNQATYTSK